MATVELQTGMPPLVLAPGTTLTLEAIDPATGAAVAGVNVGPVAFYGLDARDAEGELLTVNMLPTQGSLA